MEKVGVFVIKTLDLDTIKEAFSDYERGPGLRKHLRFEWDQGGFMPAKKYIRRKWKEGDYEQNIIHDVRFVGEQLWVAEYGNDVPHISMVEDVLKYGGIEYRLVVLDSHEEKHPVLSREILPPYEV